MPLKGSDAPFDARIHAARGQPGQMHVAGLYRALLAGSRIRESHRDCDKVQDPYSLRCQPQVMGACLDTFAQAARILEIEANAVTDNPLVFAADEAVLSGGNFHAEPVGFAADDLAAGDRGNRRHVRAPYRRPGGSEDERSAAVPGSRTAG